MNEGNETGKVQQSLHFGPSGTLTIFLGAGFSKWAAGLPVVSELFDYAVRPVNQREISRLLSFQKYKGAWDKLHPSTHPEEFIADGLASRRHRLVVWYITRRLSEPFMAPIFGGMQALMIDDRRKWKVLGVQKARDFLAAFPPGQLQGILTCNYDLLIEYSLGTDGFNYGEPGLVLLGRGKNPQFPWHFIPVALTGEMPVAKLHGSISWDESNYYTDGRCGVKGTALIVPPVPEKVAPASLKNTWSLAANLLSKTTKLLVFGFAFNPYDTALLAFLRDKGAGIASVLLVNPSPPVQLARKVWPKADVTACEPPPNGADCIQAWIGAKLRQ